MKDLIEWTEGDRARGRKLVLFATVLVFLICTIMIIIAGLFFDGNVKMVESIYYSFTGLMAIIYGFYTGTSSDKAEDVINRAVDMLYDKLKLKQRSNDDTTDF